MIKAVVNPGICGLPAQITASGDMMKVELAIESTCPHIQKIAAELKEISPMQEIFGKFDTSRVYALAAMHCQHLACPMPSAIIKAIEAAGGLALPAEVSIILTKDET